MTGKYSVLIAGLFLFPLCASMVHGEFRFGTMGAVRAAEKSLDEKTPPADTPCSNGQLAALEQSLGAALDLSPLTDFTLLLESADGRTYAHSKGTSSPATSYESASTSKLVTATAILWVVDQLSDAATPMTLDSRPQDFIPWWTPASTNPVSGVTLRHLLSFTSGLGEDPPPPFPAFPLLTCMDYPGQDFESCVQEIYETNLEGGIAPGSQFLYASTHLQIAGLMAVYAGGYADWTALFADFKNDTGLFPEPASVYDLPSLDNPRLAGGMHWTGEEYLALLRALYRGNVLTRNLRQELLGDQRNGAAVVLSPLLLAPPNGLGEDWRYGLGNWVECPGGCAGTDRNSSPGAYGAYPFLDFKNNYFGILARQGPLGSFPEGIELFRSVEGKARKWATKSCGN